MRKIRDRLLQTSFVVPDILSDLPGLIHKIIDSVNQLILFGKRKALGQPHICFLLFHKQQMAAVLPDLSPV